MKPTGRENLLVGFIIQSLDKTAIINDATLDYLISITPASMHKVYQGSNIAGTPIDLSSGNNDIIAEIYKHSNGTDSAVAKVYDIRSNHAYYIRKVNGVYQGWITIF